MHKNNTHIFFPDKNKVFQIIPATVIAILVAVGAKNPTEIIAPAMIVTSIAFVSAILIAKIFQKFWKPQVEEVSND